MFLMHFKMLYGMDDALINLVLPMGWTAQKSDNNGLLWVVDSLSGKTIGSITKQPGKIVIEVDEQKAEGQVFWQTFGLKYPRQNPFDLRFGVLYLPDGQDSQRELHEFPGHFPDEVLGVISHYVNANDPFYVSFFLGDWHWQTSVKVQTCRKINRDGSLGKDQGKLLFTLGSIENKDTK